MALAYFRQDYKGPVWIFVVFSRCRAAGEEGECSHQQQREGRPQDTEVCPGKPRGGRGVNRGVGGVYIRGRRGVHQG